MIIWSCKLQKANAAEPLSKLLKLSQEELAEKCECHPTYIGQVERGEKNATLESINKIAVGLNISPNTPFENIEESCARKA